MVPQMGLAGGAAGLALAFALVKVRIGQARHYLPILFVSGIVLAVRRRGKVESVEESLDRH